MTAQAGSRAGPLLGRRSERAALDRLVADVLAGSSRVLVLRGDAGVGKSALLGYLAEHVGGWRIATVGGVESERELSYGGLHQLCAPLLEHLDRLPVPQRDGLATVFGLRAGPAPDRLLVGLATLTLLAEAAAQHPLVCLVDDAQWLDRASAQIFAFVARRLGTERVAVVGAVRTGPGDDVLAGLPTLPVGGLNDTDARTLLLGSVHGPLDVGVSDRIISESHGNPLALLELPRTWTAADLAGGFGLPGGRPVTGRIEQGYLQRLLPLPEQTRLLVLAAAADPVGDPALLDRAVRVLGIDMTAAAPAVDAGLLQVRGRVAFTHPLARSAAYRAAPAGDRHRAHRALAEATDAGTDPDRRAWHRAGAAAGPDEDVATELERSAGRAQARGGISAAAAFLTRATELTPGAATRVRRALAAAAAGLQAGAFDAVRAVLAIAGQGPADERQRARIELVRAQLMLAARPGDEATPLLLAAARRLQDLEPGLARRAYLDAFAAARLGAGTGGAEVARAVRAAPCPPGAGPATGELLLAAAGALTGDYGAAVAPGRAALRELRTGRVPAGERLRWLRHGAALAFELGDDESAYLVTHRHLQAARSIGALGELPPALGLRTALLVLCGELPAAAALVEEARSVTAATGVETTPYGALFLAAWRGHDRETRDLVEATVREAAPRGEGLGVAVGGYAHAVLCNGLGRYDEVPAAGRVPFWGLAELIEAASRTGRAPLAADALDRLAARARAAGTDWVCGLEARSRALLSEGPAAEAGFRRALTHLGRTRIRAELARAHLLYGEWLRRTNRRVDARGQLRTAHELFTGMGMTAFAERTRRELLAAGSAVVARGSADRDGLTAQETAIAHLARDGLSNPEIGARLFLSARTVEWHLRKVFTKLGITSRRQLRGILAR